MSERVFSIPIWAFRIEPSKANVFSWDYLLCHKYCLRVSNRDHDNHMFGLKENWSLRLKNLCPWVPSCSGNYQILTSCLVTKMCHWLNLYLLFWGWIFSLDSFSVGCTNANYVLLFSDHKSYVTFWLVTENIEQ